MPAFYSITVRRETSYNKTKREKEDGKDTDI